MYHSRAGTSEIKRAEQKELSCLHEMSIAPRPVNTFPTLIVAEGLLL
jgi:hypothetical protein